MRKLGLTVSAAFAVATAGLAGHAVAAGRSGMLGHIVAAMAVAKVCTQMEIDDQVIASVAARDGIDLSDGSSDRQIMLALGEYEVKALGAYDMQTVCMIGNRFYGPAGSTVPGLLRNK
jgi:hypothetical protein